MRKVVALRKINLAILCVPAEVAQRVADLLVASGIRGILNFAPVPLVVPPHVNLVAVDLSIQLENLAYKVQKTQGEVSCAGLAFPTVATMAKMKPALPGGETVSQQVLVLFFQVRILAG